MQASSLADLIIMAGKLGIARQSSIARSPTGHL